MLINVTPKGLYEVPEGTFQAVCVEAEETQNKSVNPPAKTLRIVWELPDLQVDSFPRRASKTYKASLAEGSVLRRDLESWFGGDLSSGMFDTKTLVGKSALITIQHTRTPGYQSAARRVMRVQPPGS
jgi:hypothetical protein